MISVDHDQPLNKPATPEHGFTAAVMGAPDVKGADRARCQPGCIHRHGRCWLLLMDTRLGQAPDGLIQSRYQGSLVEPPKETV